MIGKKRLFLAVIIVFFSLNILFAQKAPTPLSEVNRILFFATLNPLEPTTLLYKPDSSFDLSLENDKESFQSKISWEQKDHLLFSAALEMSTRSIIDTNLDTSRFDGFDFRPTVHFEFTDIRLTVDLEGRVAPIFNFVSFVDGNYDFHNQLNYDIQINLLDFLFPQKRDFITTLYLKGNVTQKSGYVDFSEQRISNKSSVRFGGHYEKKPFINVTAGILLFNEEKIDLTLPHPAEELLSRLHLDLGIIYNFKEYEFQMQFTPTINRKGNVQDSLNTILALSSTYKM